MTDAELAAAFREMANGSAVYFDSDRKLFALAAHRLESRPSTSGQEISEAMKFIADLADEELQYAKVGTGAEVALRHISRKARAVLQDAQKG